MRHRQLRPYQAACGAAIKVCGAIHGNLTIKSPVTITAWPSSPAGSAAVLDRTGDTIVCVGVEVTGVALYDLIIENGSVGGISNDGALAATGCTMPGMLAELSMTPDSARWSRAVPEG